MALDLRDVTDGHRPPYLQLQGSTYALSMPRTAFEHQCIEAVVLADGRRGMKIRAQQRLYSCEYVITHTALRRYVWQNAKEQPFCESVWGIRKSGRQAVVVGAGDDKMNLYQATRTLFNGLSRHCSAPFVRKRVLLLFVRTFAPLSSLRSRIP